MTELKKTNDIRMLKKRADFLRLRHAGRWANPHGHSAKRGTKTCLVQMAAGQESPVTRVGYIVTKKIGNAVVRNRIKRRLKAAVQDVFPGQALAGHDYVLIARPEALHRSYEDLCADLLYALDFTQKTAYPQKTNAS